jgi:adenosylhomocysteine nucleosidase
MLSNAAFVCGLENEARCLTAAGIKNPVAPSGARPARAAEIARELLASGADSLISFGLAGGLDPRLGPGSVIVADRVLAWHRAIPSEPLRGFGNMFHLRGPTDGEDAPHAREAAISDGEFETDAELRAQLLGVLSDKTYGGGIVGVDRAVTAPGDKLGLFAATAGVACDMESHAVAEVAAAAGIPFLVLRVVSDPSNRSVPQAALSGVTAAGRVSPGRVLLEVSRRPWELLELLSLALDARIAFGALRRVARRGAPLFNTVG